MDKKAIAEVLQEIGVLLEIKGENPFKIRAYQTGARALDTLEESLDTLIAEERLAAVKGIGNALAEKIAILHAEGKLDYHEKLKASVAPGLLDLLDIPGLGAKKIKALHTELGIDSIDSLTQACQAGKVAELAGFGVKTQDKLLAGIRNREAYGRRHLWIKARAAADPILAALREQPGVERAESAGSLRRGMETVGDLDFIAACRNPRPVMDWFVALDGVQEVTAHGETKSSIRLLGGLQADLRIVPPEQFVFALHHFTGSKDHNVAMRQRALARGYSLSEWGLSMKEEADSTQPVPPTSVESEAELFDFLGLTAIPPALREGRGEIEAAEAGQLPRLIETADLTGAFHNHTTASDGSDSLEVMARAAAELGWSYLGIADHSRASYQANGLDEKRLAQQIEAIRNLNARGDLPHLFSGVECDILPDGSLDLDDSILAELDYVVISVHSSFNQSEEDMTRRIIRALEHPLTTMLGHITGRLLLKREPYQVNIPKVIDCAIAHGKVIELNANPARLDMDWRHWRRAAERGLLCAINPDAHAAEHLCFVECGVQAARKGWLTKEQVLNTRPLDAVKTWLKEARQR